MTHILEVRPHGYNSRKGWLPANSIEEARNLVRIFGGDIIDPITGIQY